MVQNDTAKIIVPGRRSAKSACILVQVDLDSQSLTAMQLADQPPSSDVRSTYSCSSGASLGRSRNRCLEVLKTGVVPVILQRGLIRSTGFSMDPQMSH